MAARRNIFAFYIFLARGALAQPDLEQARALFDEALKDQEQGQADVALEKFRRVAKVRDTTQVEFRVASCLDALGKKREALKAYELSVRLGRGDPHTDDVVVAANDRITKLATTMGKIDIDLRGGEHAEVRVDGELLAKEELRAPILLESGSHVVEARAPGSRPVQTTVNIVAGQRLGVGLELRRTDAEVLPETHTTRRDVGWVLVSVGAASAIGSMLTLFFRHDTIATIQSDCPNNSCPISRQNEIEGLRSTANALGPVAAVLGGVAIGAVGVGVVLVALGRSHTVTAWLAPTLGGLAMGGRF